MGYRLITPPVTYPVTLAQAKAQCRVDGSDDDAHMALLISSATAQAETLTGRAIVAQTWELLQDDFCGDEILLEKGPVQSITSVKYYDGDGVLQTLSTDYYVLDATAEPQRVVLVDGYTWPDVADGINKVIVRFVAGYSTVPPQIIQACLLLIGQWYDQRAGTSDKPITETPNAVRSLLYSQQAMVI